MDDGEAGEADALSRLEAALDRIAARRRRRVGPADAGIDTGMIASRLDAVIGRLRHALADEA